MKALLSIVFILLIFTIPIAAHAIQVGEKAQQESAQVTIDSKDNVHVKHVIKSAGTPKQLDLIPGDVSNLMVTDLQGVEAIFSAIGDGESILILPSKQETVVEYDLDGALIKENDVWFWNFLYVQRTSFVFPKEIELIFVNERPIVLDEKSAIMCHGCQMNLAYTVGEQKNIQNIQWEDKEFDVEFITHADIENFVFDQTTKSITFNVNESEFIRIIIPLELLWNPYTILHNDELITFHNYINNDTHIGITLKPSTAGEITIIGTTVIPEFSILIPLVVGFMIILLVPLTRFNLH